MCNFEKRKKNRRDNKIDPKGWDIESHLFRGTQRWLPPKDIEKTF